MNGAIGEAPSGYRLCDMADGPFARSIGPLYIRLDGVGFAFVAGERHCNARGVVHGGMLMTFADQTLGLTVQRTVGSVDVATVSLNCDLVDGVRPGELVEGEAVVTRITRSLVFVQGSVRCNARPVLTASGLWKILRTNQGGDRPPSQ